MANYDDTLGMNVATASSRLKKQLMYSMAVELGRDTCYRCDKPITSADELTVDHIEPWRSVSADLFWDLENIAFSHPICNNLHQRKNRKLAPEGESWCSIHKEFLPLHEFGSLQTRWNGVQHNCRSCERDRWKNRRKNPPIECPNCGENMRKTCSTCGYDMPMRDYMAMRRKEGVRY